MTRLLVGTDGTTTSKSLVEYLDAAVCEDDEVYIVNSQIGRNRTTVEDIEEGEEALDIIEEGISGLTSVESDQLVLGNQPVEDLLQAADDWGADEFVIGIRKHSPVGKMVFGSTAQNLLLEADRPVRCVPLVPE
jgi:nucleotide-binding universal stress UspA family protein